MKTTSVFPYPHTRRSFLAGAAAVSLGLPLRLGSQPAGDRPDARFGVNLSAPVDWNSELPFIDVFRMARPWISQRDGERWGSGPQLETDEFGWIRRLDDGCYAETILCSVDGGHFPGGTYTVLYDGSGVIEFDRRVDVRSRDPGRMEISIDSRNGGFRLSVRSTDPDNHLRNIRVLLPDMQARYADTAFRPGFLDRWRGVACLRYMDWMRTNNSEIVDWSQRPTERHSTYMDHGVPIETMIDLANTLETDPWFCIPHKASDDYVRRFAELVRDRLNPNLRAWVEYSNEVWNMSFRQTRDAAVMGRELGLAPREREAGLRYVAHRSLEIFDIWESAFEGNGRFVRVLPSQAATPYVSEQVAEHRDAYRRADVLAIAPYISCNVSMRDGPLTTSEVEDWTVDQALDYMEREALPRAVRWLTDQKRIADRYGLKMVAYEAGQHMVGVRGGENNEAVTELLHAANAHPRMEEIYRRYYAAWTEAGGDLLCHYQSISSWSKWGSWGIMQYADEDPRLSPKFSASLTWARSRGQALRED